MSNFKLEPTTKDTILCNQATLKTAINYLLAEIDHDYWKDFQKDLVTDIIKDFDCYPLTQDEHTDILPWFSEAIDQLVIAFDKLDNFVNHDHSNGVEDYVTSDDYKNDYAYLADSEWNNEDKLNQAIITAIKAQALGYFRSLSDTDQNTLVHSVIDRLKDLVGYECFTATGYFSSPKHDQFIDVYSFQVGEYEDQINLTSLKEQLEINLPNDQVTQLLAELNIEVRGKEHPYFYLHVNTDVTHHYGWNIKTIETTVQEILDYTPDTDIPITVIGANDKPCTETTGTCSCCGGPSRDQSNEDPEEKFRVFRAQWADSAGVFYSRLCGDLLGNGCIYDVEPKQSNYTDTIVEVSGDDLDASETDYQDMIAYKQNIED